MDACLFKGERKSREFFTDRAGYRAGDGSYFVEAQDGQVYASMGWEGVYGTGMPAARAGAI